ncbi:hypothetical protein EP7_004095 [Isosphaeraceae bacterium EP7]
MAGLDHACFRIDQGIGQVEELAFGTGVEHGQVQIDWGANTFAKEFQPDDLAPIGVNEIPVFLITGFEPPANLARPGDLLGLRGLMVLLGVEKDGNVGDSHQNRRGRARKIDREFIDRESRRTLKRSRQGRCSGRRRGHVDLDLIELRRIGSGTTGSSQIASEQGHTRRSAPLDDVRPRGIHARACVDIDPIDVFGTSRIREIRHVDHVLAVGRREEVDQGIESLVSSARTQAKASLVVQFQHRAELRVEPFCPPFDHHALA